METIGKAIALIEPGFSFASDMEGAKLFSKLK
jgi:hypothetical protein